MVEFCLFLALETQTKLNEDADLDDGCDYGDCKDDAKRTAGYDLATLISRQPTCLSHKVKYDKHKCLVPEKDNKALHDKGIDPFLPTKQVEKHDDKVDGQHEQVYIK